MLKKSLLLCAFILLVTAITSCNTPKTETTEEITPIVMMEMTDDLKVVKKYTDYKLPSSFTKDKNGNRLISDYMSANFYSISPDGNIVWIYKGNNPEYIEKTAEDTYLIVNESGENSVMEVDQLGNTVWQSPPLDHPAEAHKLPNGNYLIVVRNENKIIEMDPKNKVVWQTSPDLLRQPYSVEILPSGNLLIADFDNHRVIEINRHNEILWQMNQGLNHPIVARELPNGNIIISDKDNNRVTVVDRKGYQVKEKTNINVRNIIEMPNGNLGVTGKQV